MSTEINDEKIRAEALAGPWVAVLADPFGYVIGVADIDNYADDPLTVQIVRGQAAPGARDDGEDDRLPGTYPSADHLVTWDDFDELDDVRTRWIQAQAMVAGLNAAAPAAPAGGAQ